MLVDTLIVTFVLARIWCVLSVISLFVFSRCPLLVTDYGPVSTTGARQPGVIRVTPSGSSIAWLHSWHVVGLEIAARAANGAIQ